MTRFRLTLLATALVAFAASGCSSDSGTTKKDGSVTPKDGGVKDTGNPSGDGSVPVTMDCSDPTKCKDFVLSDIKLPGSQSDADKYGMDLDGDGSKDNALGSILSALVQISPSLNLQSAMDSALNQGSTLIGVRVMGGDFAKAAKAAAQAWLLKAKACCTSKDDVAKCKTEAATTCFSGSVEFEKTDAANNAVFAGSITDGKGKFGPSTLKINLPLSAGVIELNLVSAQFMGTFNGGKIEGGVIAGGITEDELNNQVIPNVAKLLDATIKDATVSADTKTQIKNLFDTNKDGSISVDEVKNNSLIQTFLQPDVTLGGKRCLSLGIGYGAVGAKIK